MSTGLCSFCFSTTCPKASSASAACENTEFLDSLAARDANGTYDISFRGRLPHAAGSLSDAHFDALTGFRPVESSCLVLSTGAEALSKVADFVTTVDGTAGAPVGHLVEIYRNQPHHRNAIFQRLENLLFAGLTADQLGLVKSAIDICKGVNQGNKDKLVSKATDAGDLEDRISPLARSLLLLTRYRIARKDMSKLAITPGVFDTTTGGQKAERFASIQEVTDAELKNSIFRDFEELVAKLPGTGGRAKWQPLFQFLGDLSERGEPPALVHSLLFECCKKIDGTPGLNIISFMAQHWMITFTTFHAQWHRENFKPAGHRDGPDPTGGSRQPQGSLSGSQHGSSFGPHTQNNASSGSARTKEGNIAFCNRWNSNRPCNVGVKFGPDKGKCPYVHRCSCCNSADHRGTDKQADGPNKGDPVCPEFQTYKKFKA